MRWVSAQCSIPVFHVYWAIKKNLSNYPLLTLEFLGLIVHKSNTEKRRNQTETLDLEKIILKNENFVVAERGPEEQVGGTGGEGREESS